MAKTMPMRNILVIMLVATAAFAGSADDDWSALLKLDAGPGVQPKTAAEAREISLAHLARQETALRDFLKSYSADPRTFEARFRLIRLLNLRADLTSKPSPGEVERLLDEAKEAAKSPAQKTELDFALLNERMRASRGKRPTPDERRELMKAVRAFQTAHPKDRRVPTLLVEVANMFEAEPPTKHALLVDAKKLTEDSALLAQIADDQKRLSFLGKKLPLKIMSLDGKRIDLEELAGNPVAILFFATWSEPSVAVFEDMENAARKNKAAFIAISLDSDSAALKRFIQKRKTSAIIACDGKGWNSPLILALGLNAIPAAWLVDKAGVLRSLDALDDPVGLLRQLAR